MAQNAPQPIDVDEIQFRTQSKYKIFGGESKLRDHVSLLAAASNAGLLFVGNPYKPELKALILQDMLYAKEAGKNVHLHKVTLPSAPNVIACSADGSMLAVSYSFQNYGVLDIYQVASFAIGAPKLLYSIQLPNENAFTLQLLWNPVLTNVIGVVSSNGDFGVYTLKEGGTIEISSLKNQQVKCGCWSPKGKQIVLGFPGGKLQQFKPDLTPTKRINCPTDVHPGDFDVIAVHWLSTFQFIVCFLQNDEEALPSFYIVNVPKGSDPTYISYNDICYSFPGPRAQQVQFVYVSQWNLLLVSSANGLEVGILGSRDGSDLPTWIHYVLLDEARIELPLTDNCDETYPIGLSLDTSSVHRLTLGDFGIVESMPMVHILSTHGDLLSFNLINTTPNAANICSPPPPIKFELEKFTILVEEEHTNQDYARNSSFSSEILVEEPIVETATPTAVPSPTFNIQSNNFQSSTLLTTDVEPHTNVQILEIVESNKSSLANELKRETTGTFSTERESSDQSTERFKPLYTVSPVFTAPSTDIVINQHVKEGSTVSLSESTGKTKSDNLDMVETHNVTQQMIALLISSFDKEVEQSKNIVKLDTEEDLNDLKKFSSRLLNFQDLVDQAKDRDFISDVQNLHQSLTESYEMLLECRTKLEAYTNPEESEIKRLNFLDCISQRQLNNLRRYLDNNHATMRKLQEKIEFQETYYQDLVRRNSKTHTRIPYLHGIYQQMTKLKQLLTEQRTKIFHIKSVLKQHFKSTDKEFTIDSIADTMLSLSISRVGDVKSSKLSKEKLNSIRNFATQQRQINCIKPQRPTRKELRSEVILESKVSINPVVAPPKSEENILFTKNASTFTGFNSKGLSMLTAISNVSKPIHQTGTMANVINISQNQPITKLNEQPQDVQPGNINALSEKKGATTKAADITAQNVASAFRAFSFKLDDGYNIQNVKTPNTLPTVSAAAISITSTSSPKTYKVSVSSSPSFKPSSATTVSFPAVPAENPFSFVGMAGFQSPSFSSVNPTTTLVTTTQNPTTIQTTVAANAFLPTSTASTALVTSFGGESKEPVKSMFADESTSTSAIVPSPTSTSIFANATENSANLSGSLFHNSSSFNNNTGGSIFGGSSPSFKSSSGTTVSSTALPAETPFSFVGMAGFQPLSFSPVNPTTTLVTTTQNPIIIPTTVAASAFHHTSTESTALVASLGGESKEPLKTMFADASSSTSDIVPSTTSTSLFANATENSANLSGSLFHNSSSFNSKTGGSIFGGSSPSFKSSSGTTVSSTALPAETPFSFVGMAGFQPPSFSSVNPTTTLVTTTQNPIIMPTTVAANAFLPTSTASTTLVTSFGSESKEPVKRMFADSSSSTSDIVPSTTSTSIFANATENSSNTSGNLLDNSSSFNSNTGGSIYGGSVYNQITFEKPTATAFLSPATTSPPSATPTASNFSLIGSLFGNATSGNSISGGSIFDGSVGHPAESQSFGAPGFNANPSMGATSSFSAFTQGPSVSNTSSPTQHTNISFGSPAPQVNPFSKPGFGGAPVFGGPPVLGSQPSFGGTPTFGSPNILGTFAPNAPQIGSPAQNNNIFEALGAKDTGLSFGNLAQTAKPAQPAPMPKFAGSSFQNYR